MKCRDLEKRMRHMGAEIAGENPTPLEVMLTERVVAGWLLVEVLEALIAAQYRRALKDRRLVPGFLIQCSRILESATRRYQGARQGEEAAGRNAGSREHAGERAPGVACNALEGA